MQAYRKVYQKIELVARIKGYDTSIENGKIVIRKRGRVVFIVEITETGFAISSPISQEDWDEGDMILFEYINTVLMEYTLLKKLKFLENNK